MTDKLKQFIDDNREAFDTENPSAKLFRNLEKQLTSSSDSYFSKIQRAIAVAAIVIVSSLVYFIFPKKNNNTVDETVTIQNPANSKEGITDPVYAKQIGDYQELIGLQQIQLRQVGKDHPELYHQFADDINQLDSAYRNLKVTMEQNPNTEVLLEAMIHNLQLQTDLLNRQLIIIKEIKQKSKT